MALTIFSNKRYSSILRYPGGKRKLLPRIGKMLDAGRTKQFDRIIEPFAGGASVSLGFLECGLAEHVVLSDRDPLVAGLWKTVFSNRAGALADLIEDAEVSLEAWHQHRASEPDGDVERAFKCLFLNRTSFSGSLHEEAGPIGGQTQAGQYKVDCRFNRDALIARILELSKYKGSVEVLEKDFREVAQRYAVEHGTSALWYLDPPYFKKADKLYRFTFADTDHCELKAILEDLPGSWLLSYDACDEAREFYGDHAGYEVFSMRHTAARHQENIAPQKPKEVLVSNLPRPRQYSLSALSR